MNIGPLVRSMIGDSKQGESKSLELKTGQVVRGTVLSVSDNGQEAVIQVQGVKLHATLETPLQQGQTTLLQVQQPNEDGTVVLKPMDSLPQKMLSGNSLLQIMQSLGLEDTESNRQLINQMQATGVPLTKDNVNLLGQLLTNRPQQVPLSEWIQAAGIALGRGLPVTAQSVAGLHQAIFGPPLHELMSTLEDGINQWLSQQAKGNGQATQQSNNLGTLVNQNNNTLAGANPTLTAGQTSTPNSALVETANQSMNSKANESLQVAQGQAGASDPKTATAMQKLEQALGQLRQILSSDSLFEPQASNSAKTVLDATGGALSAKQTQESTITMEGKAQSQSPLLNERQAGVNINSEPWVGRVLKLLGVEHEQQVHLNQNKGGVDAPSPSSKAVSPEATGIEAQGQEQGKHKNIEASTANTTPIANNVASSKLESATQGINSERIAFVDKAINQHPTSESLKGLLLQLADADELPAPLKEVIKQVVQQLTGQQLLLNTDRTTPFAQVTMFLPFFGPDGQQTAAVHIESRRGRKGELDPANCRLWFDLQMKALGQIMVDVQVADKKVLLKIFSEHDTAGVFLESRKAEIETALEATGYHLLSLKIEQLIPNETEEVVNRDLSMAMSYTPSEYKGVDYRV
ncbi:hypothetical protein J2Z32_000823 [Paenibacillus turicensis]|uniref:Flagellar hook-length control protein-like C-terminal domain-containing protein n=1 Tax=Paenibacillus turicensis TaxID=160487 RepID=A0ABS4FNP9_9BACL|nr:flagellar hook-length control protein FliK [Paenibacillus turicensis]MBP1904206.1 hypothetical protein [Paenibacillus turicensis]